MHILWLILIGFVAGIIAKFIHPGSNEPSGGLFSPHCWVSPERLLRHILDKPLAGTKPTKALASLAS